MVYRVTIPLLAEHLLASYICDYNFIRKAPLNVVSVTTEESSASYTLPEGVHYVQAQKIRLSVSRGESIKVMVNPHSIADIVRGKQKSTGANRQYRLSVPCFALKKSHETNPEFTYINKDHYLFQIRHKKVRTLSLSPDKT